LKYCKCAEAHEVAPFATGNLADIDPMIDHTLKRPDKNPAFSATVTPHARLGVRVGCSTATLRRPILGAWPWCGRPGGARWQQLSTMSACSWRGMPGNSWPSQSLHCAR